MPLLRRSFKYCAATAATLVLLLSSGCITISPEEYAQTFSYEPVSVPIRIGASASIEVHASFTPEMHASWARINNETSIANYLVAEERCITSDIVSSGLFAQIETGPEARPPFHLKVTSVEAAVPEYKITVTLAMTETSSGETVSEHTRTVVYGKSIMDCNVREALPGLLGALKNDVATDWLTRSRAAQRTADEREAAGLENQPLASLLASSDRNALIATARNHALIAAKNQQLPALLKDSKTSDLSALVTRIEQTVLDLNHECELLQDKLQSSKAAAGSWVGLELAPSNDGAILVRSVAQGGPAAQAGVQPGDLIVALDDQPVSDVESFVNCIRNFPTGTALRLTCRRSDGDVVLAATTAPRPTPAGTSLDLALCYRERIELLKPILASIKEELANRSR